eukprot:CAMPEP_0181117622 /NCGR_PEP_ID=MMETSP1071-20121207/22629_1 /TAXON_ID=35127 /ORGANISM="Thalassiosira sp., Strain NH16" /LENGTH=777 /DNA_ID=CAMNT_0023202039 /DNA_START=111 /DNA_END=2444 /DNA_ORIENTATION=+
MERSPLCTLFLRKCCGQPQLREKDDGEWMEPIDAKKRNKRHYSVVKEGGGVQTKQTNAPPNFEKARSINWADLVKEGVGAEIDEDNVRLPSFETAALNDPKYDGSVYNSVNSAEFDSSNSNKEGSLGEVDVGPLMCVGDDSFIVSTRRSSDISVFSDMNSVVDEDIAEGGNRTPREWGKEKKAVLVSREEVAMAKALLSSVGTSSSESVAGPSPSSASKPVVGAVKTLMAGTKMKALLSSASTSSSCSESATGPSPSSNSTPIVGAVKTVMAGKKMKALLSSASTSSSCSESATGPSPSSNSKTVVGAVKTVMAGKKMKALLSFGSTSSSESVARPSLPSKPKAITTIAILGDRCFLAASRANKGIRMFKTVTDDNGSSDIELVRDCEGHSLGVTTLVVLDKKGRFLSAGKDLTVKLWDSRFNCADDSNEETMGTVPKPMTLLSTFGNLDSRWVHSIGVLHEGSFVRPTDEIDGAMLTAVGKQAVFKGAASVQRAAIQREIIECSGSFITASKNSSIVNVWDIHVVEKTEDSSNQNVAKTNLGHALEHEASIQAMATMPDKILTGDIMGDVHLWEYTRNAFRAIRKNWTKQRKFTPWRGKGPHSPAKITENMVLHLCFLNKGRRFIAGSNSGVIRVWDIEGTKKVDVVHKKDAQSVKVTQDSLSGICQLPSIEDPNTRQECLAFAVSSTDGRVVSMAVLQHPRSSKQERSELVIFDTNDYSHNSNDGSEAEVAIHSIAALEATLPSGNSRNSHDPIIIAGDGNGSIHLSKPVWDSEC